MKKFITVCCLVLSLVSFGSLGTESDTSVKQCSFLENGGLSEQQKSVLRYSYERGKEYDLGLTLASIAWVESTAGIDRVNWSDPAFGAYQIVVHDKSSAVKRLNVTDKVAQVHLANQLVVDDILGATLALMELEYWKARHKGDWRKMVMSYNAGTSYKNGKNYLNKIKLALNKLRDCYD